MTTLAELNTAVQDAPGANAQVKAWIAAATPLIEPPPPATGTRAVYLNNATDASASALIPALKAASYNTVLIAGQWTATIAALRAAGMGAWVTLGQFSNGAFTMDEAAAVDLAQEVAAQLPGSPFYLADEPPLGNTADAQLILDRQDAIKAALPDSTCMIAYYDAGTVKIYKGIGLVASSIYPNKFGFNWQLVTQFGQACQAAAIPFTSVIAIASDTQPIPSAAQIQTWDATAKAAGSQGFAVYTWGLGAEQPQYVQAVQGLS